MKTTEAQLEAKFIELAIVRDQFEEALTNLEQARIGLSERHLSNLEIQATEMLFNSTTRMVEVSSLRYRQLVDQLLCLWAEHKREPADAVSR